MIDVYIIHDDSPNSKVVLDALEQVSHNNGGVLNITFRDVNKLSSKLHKEVKSVLWKHGTDKIPFTTLGYDDKIFRAIYMEEINNIKEDYPTLFIKKLNDVLLIKQNESE